MSDADYEAHLADLRRLYVEATPSQRYSIARQRIANPEHGPNVLIACVSAVEGLARSLAMHRRASSKADLNGIYPEFKRRGPSELVAEYLAAGGLPDPENHFGEGVWKRFQYAIEYRNVLAHECTYLDQDRSPGLIEACLTVLHKLASTAGLKVDDA